MMMMMMMMRRSSRIALLFFFFFFFLLLCDGMNGDDVVVCGEKERAALLNFKQGLKDPSNRLSSWSSLPQLKDCCTWTGVRCNNLTARVVQLHLQNPYDPDFEYESYKTHQLGGKITPSLRELEYLIYLDLSKNNFTGATVPTFLGSMASLRYLNLSYSVFGGSIPHQLGNLSTLRVLDLSHNYIKGLIPHQLGNLSSLRHLDLSYNDKLYVDDLSWIIGVHSLEYLDLSWIDPHKAVDWLQAVSMLPSLSELHLRGCELGNMIPPLLAFVNFTSLTVLDLSYNNFNCKISDLLFNLTSSSLMSLQLFFSSLYGHIPGSISNLRLLRNLNLGSNYQITGKIPDGIGQLKHLESLILSENSLYGPIPPSIGNLSSLRILYLYNNQLNDTLPKSMGFLSNVEVLYVSDNSLAGIVSEVHFATVSKLKYLDMSSNSLFFNMSSNWVPPFQLHYLLISSCKMGPRFPSWLQTQTSLIELDISQSEILGVAPEWLWKWVSHIDYISLSYNQINGDISNVLLNSSVIDLSSNHFEGQLPHLSPNVQVLILANNSFFGLISPFLCQEINGKSKLEVLDLSNNLLSGGLSDCWIQWQSLTNVNLASNHLSGKIPNSIGSLAELQVLQLHNNFLREIPLSLQNCTYLSFINLGGNEFTGLIPSWIGEMLNLEVLSLRSNKFISNIPSQICQLSELIILDLGNNYLSGPIPKCLKNISALMTSTSSSFDVTLSTEVPMGNKGVRLYRNKISLVTKGRESEYRNFLRLVRSIDLSGNNLSGSFPDEFSSLDALRFLNLSHNQITGTIPKNIGGMTMLESFDLSRNHILGEIPQSMSNLTFLSYLNLSYNNFSGRIPSGTQLQSFNATSYIGNAELCGAPLNNNCTREEESQGRGMTSIEKEEEESEMVWFYTAMGPGFAVGFWVVCGTLLFKRTWRHAYFQLLDDAKEWIYLAILLKLNRLHKKFKRSNNA